MANIEEESDTKERENRPLILSSFSNTRVQINREEGCLRAGKRVCTRSESNAEKKKKNPPQRGMGVEKLERLRALEEQKELNNMPYNEIATAGTPTATRNDANSFHDYHQPLLPRSSWTLPATATATATPTPTPTPMPQYPYMYPYPHLQHSPHALSKQLEIADVIQSYSPGHPNATFYQTLNIMHSKTDSPTLHLQWRHDQPYGHPQPQEEMLAIPAMPSTRSKELSSFQNLLRCSTPFPISKGKSNNISTISKSKRRSCGDMQLKQQILEMKQSRLWLPGATKTLSASPSINVSSGEETETETDTEINESPHYPSSSQMTNSHDMNHFQRNGLAASTNLYFPLQKAPQKPLQNIQTSMLIRKYGDHPNHNCDHDHGYDGNDDHSIGFSLGLDHKHDQLLPGSASPWVCNREDNAHRIIPPYHSPASLNISRNDNPKVSFESGGHIFLFGAKLFQQDPLNYPSPSLARTSDIVESSSSRVTWNSKEGYSSTSSNGALDLTLKLSL